MERAVFVEDDFTIAVDVASLTKPEGLRKGCLDRMCNGFDKGLMCVCGPCFIGGTYISRKISRCFTGQEIPLSGMFRCCAISCSISALLAYGVFPSNPTGYLPLPSDDEVASFCAVPGACAACMSYLAYRLEKRQNRAPARIIMEEASDRLKTE